MLPRRAVALGASLAAVAIVGSFVATRATRTSKTDDATADAASMPAPHFAGHRFVPGREVTYAVTYATDGSLGAGASAGASHLVSTLRARMLRTVLGASPRDGYELVLHRFVDAEIAIVIDESPRATDAARVEAELARGFIVEMARNGTIASIRIDPAASSMSRALARTLAASTQLTFAPDAASTWQSREVDTNGPYVATYAVVPRLADDVLALRKTKHALKLRDDARGAPRVVFLRAETGSTAVVEYDFDRAQGEVTEIASDETTDTSLGDLPLARAQTTFDAERTSGRTLDGAALAALMTQIAPLLDAPPTALDAHDGDASDSAKTEASRHWLGSSTLPQITRDLDDESRTPREGRRFDLFLKLEAYAFLHPDECATVARLLIARASRGSASAIIVEALAASGSKEAQAALVEAATAKDATDDAKLLIVPALGMLASPLQTTEDAVRLLRDTSKRRDVAAAAALALGIMARSIATTAPARASRIVEDALDRLARDANDEDGVRFDLSVIGNTGSPRMMDDVSKLSRARSPAVRGQAAFALRFVANVEAESRLLELLANDDDAAVRARAASALSYRAWTAESARVQRARLADEPDDAIRAEILRTLTAWGEP